MANVSILISLEVKFEVKITGVKIMNPHITIFSTTAVTEIKKNIVLAFIIIYKVSHLHLHPPVVSTGTGSPQLCPSIRLS
jgi:hypothetical protein